MSAEAAACLQVLCSRPTDLICCAHNRMNRCLNGINHTLASQGVRFDTSGERNDDNDDDDDYRDPDDGNLGSDGYCRCCCAIKTKTVCSER